MQEELIQDAGIPCIAETFSAHRPSFRYFVLSRPHLLPVVAGADSFDKLLERLLFAIHTHRPRQIE